VVAGVDKYIPVDVYVAGCPPTPQALLYGILELYRKVDNQHISQTPWYAGRELPEYPVPVLGPDIVDLRKADDIAASAEAFKEEQVAAAVAEAEPVESTEKTMEQEGEA
jgi:hypothetical protein